MKQAENHQAAGILKRSLTHSPPRNPLHQYS